jgi:fused signal recognition particle receptor
MLGRFLRRRPQEEEQKNTEKAVQRTKRTWFGKVVTVFKRGRLGDDTWDELEELLISADVGVRTTEKILGRLRERVRKEGITDPNAAMEVLKEEMVSILEVEGSADTLAGAATPIVILVVGVNGVGKTTGIAKLTKLFQDDGKKVVLGAADTFRAAAIDQLQMWGSRLGTDVIAHKPGADPGAVAFDTLQAARARNADVVIIDTAGRLHTKFNLMEELKKIQRVLSVQGAETQRVLLVLDATTGQNGLTQARSFMESAHADGVYLSKLDGTAKGGIVLAIADELNLPVLYIGTGEQPDDIAVFDPHDFVEELFDTDGDDEN